MIMKGNIWQGKNKNKKILILTAHLELNEALTFYLQFMISPNPNPNPNIKYVSSAFSMGKGKIERTFTEAKTWSKEIV